MSWILGIAIALVAIGFEKAIVEPVARQLFRRATNRFIEALPAVYRRVDHLIPDMVLGAMPPQAFEGVVRGALEEVTGESWAKAGFSTKLFMGEAVNEFFRQYDPRQAAKNLPGRTASFGIEDPFDGPLPVALTPPVES